MPLGNQGESVRPRPDEPSRLSSPILSRPVSVREVSAAEMRCRVPPYGFAVQNGKLVTNRKEMQICRLVVELVQRKGLGHSAVARELSRRGFKNRAGNTHWDSKTIFNILKRWQDKI